MKNRKRPRAGTEKSTFHAYSGCKLTGMEPGQVSLSIGALSDRGQRRAVNEDFYQLVQTSGGQLLVVADGLGGHAGGEVASRAAVECVSAAFRAGPVPEPGRFLESVIYEAHRHVAGQAAGDPALTGMGTTLDLVLIQASTAHLAHVGDSRVYHLRAGELKQITRDHSMFQNMLEKGVLPADEMQYFSLRHVLTQAVGIGSPTPDMVRLPLQSGDVLLLCTDGLTGVVKDAEIRDTVVEHDPVSACRVLVELANRRGGPDNITVVIARVAAVEGT